VIPFNKPVVLGTELEAIGQAFARDHVGGGGRFGARCEELLARRLGVPALLVTSCTHALELSAHLLSVGPGDEVILPSFTFVSTANAVVLRGARPVFADVDEMGNLEVAQVAALRTDRTRAVCVVHYGGNCCDMDALLAAAGPVPVIEDAAQAIGASFRGRPLGALGACGAFSFHETKHIGCGEGGALSLRDPALLERAEVFRDKGTNRKRFLQGLVDKYTWVDVGSSFSLSELNAAVLVGQLERFDEIAARRRALWERYDHALAPELQRAGAYAIRGRADAQPNHNVYALVLRTPAQRNDFIARMKAGGVQTPFHYVALHRSPRGEQLHDGRALPNTDRLATCLVRLPLYYNLRDEEQAQVIERAAEILRTF
jgi:dTDP-4-amino-4,6-dideoxygalactose transaminase